MCFSATENESQTLQKKASYSDAADSDDEQIKDDQVSICYTTSFILPVKLDEVQ